MKKEVNDILIAIKKLDNLKSSDWGYIIEEIFNKVDSHTMMQFVMHITQKHIQIKDKLLSKTINELENAHPEVEDKLIGFLPYVRQHTKNGTNLNGSCQIFYEFFSKWLIEAKKRLFNDSEWQERLDCKIFINNLRKSLLSEEEIK